MKLKHTVITNQRNASWVKELEELLQAHRVGFGTPDAEIITDPSKSETAQSPLIFVDAHMAHLNDVIGKLSQKRRVIFLIMKEDFSPEAPVPDVLVSGLVHDVLVYPFRPLEVLGKLRMYQQLIALQEVATINESFTEVLGRFKDDLELAERLQNARMKPRFPNIKGMKIHSRYFAGLKSGGDFFDVAEVQSTTGLSPVSFVLTDSSSYGLSSLVLGVLIRVVMKLASAETISAMDAVKKIHAELGTLMSEKIGLVYFTE